MVMILALLLVPVQRHGVLGSLGISFDRSLKFHRFLGLLVSCVCFSFSSVTNLLAAAAGADDLPRCDSVCIVRAGVLAR
jgi:hypothetical protein